METELIKIDSLSEAELGKLVRSETFSLKKLKSEELDKLCKRLICFDDDFSYDLYDKACAERRARETRIEKRKAKRIADGKEWGSV
jgi:gamma-glutamylcysteine synthetase